MLLHLVAQDTDAGLMAFPKLNSTPEPPLWSDDEPAAGLDPLSYKVEKSNLPKI